MNKERSLLLRYMFSRRKNVAVVVICFAVFSLMSWLCGMTVDNVLYSLLLLGAVFLVMGIFGYFRFRERHIYLKHLSSRLISSPGERLPDGTDAIDEDYREVIRALCDELVRVNSAADQKSAEMRDYYAMWAHQIKTPIAAMRLLLQTERGEQNAELTGELFLIEQYAEMVMQYIRSDSGSSDYLLREYELDAIIRQAIRKYSPSFIRKKIGLCYEGVGITVLTDEKWLCFAIEQIISNALKYTKNGSVTIEADGQALIISDTGIGIRPEDLPRVFENGYTGYNGRQDKKSTGIGLYLTKRILEKLGHSVSITSELSKGTSVRIELSREKLNVE